MAMPELFYRVVRVFFENNEQGEEVETHSIQYFEDFQEAKSRYLNICATDFGNKNATYGQCFIIDKFGRIPEGRIETFDRRDFTPPEPEPEPEPTPEPEPAPEPEPEVTEGEENG